MEEGRPERARERNLDAFLASTSRHTRPLLLGTTLIEAMAAAGTLAKLVPPWAASAILVGVPVGAWGITQQRRAGRAEALARELYHFDRRYELFLTRWTFGAGPDPDYLAATHHGERKLVALAPMRALTWTMTRRAETDAPFDGATMANTFVSRSGSGECTFRPFHKTSIALSFRIEFEPALRVGETATAMFDVHVPRFKAANAEVLRLRTRPKVPAPGDADISSTDISFPIASFVKELIIPVALGTGRHGLQVLLRDQEHRAEVETIEREKAFSVEHTVVDGEPAWRLRLERARPPIRTTYRFHWEPPALTPALTPG